MAVTRKLQIGKILLDKQLITSEQLNQAIEQQASTGRRLGQVLVDFGFIDQEVLLQIIAEQLQIPFVDLKLFQLDPEIINKLPEFYARRFKCIILEKNSQEYLLGMVDPQDIVAYDEIQNILQAPTRIALVRESDFLHVVDMVYRHATEISNLAEELSVEMGKSDYDLSRLEVGLSAAETPVVKLLQTIFQDAVQVNASDVHIEPDEQVLRIRQRIDGILHEHILKEKNVAEALALRLKLMAGLNIAEKRLPQDGRFSIKIKDKSFDVRISTMPAQFGESVVMRLLNQSATLLILDQMGLPPLILTTLRKIMSYSNGLFLITGPTGSGKTTALYAILNELNKPDVKIITVEDPVEYRLPRIVQVQTQPKIELTFARVLRSVLRQDPDIIMVGEIRDQETVEIALRAAMTGHFVFATLHTNDAISCAERLIDMGAEGYLVATVLRGVMSQRLLRRICSNCIEDYTLTPQEEIWLSEIKNVSLSDLHPKQGAGCSYCYQSGYHGQHGVYELLEMNLPLANALRLNNQIEFAQVAVQESQFRPLVLNGLDLVAEGVTTISEVMRIAGDTSSISSQSFQKKSIAAQPMST